MNGVGIMGNKNQETKIICILKCLFSASFHLELMISLLSVTSVNLVD